MPSVVELSAGVTQLVTALRSATAETIPNGIIGRHRVRVRQHPEVRLRSNCQSLWRRTPSHRKPAHTHKLKLRPT